MFRKYTSYIAGGILVVASVAGISIYTAIQHPRDWQYAEEKSKNTVVQVFAQHTTFNWLEPYKAPQQSQGMGTAFFIDKEGHLLTNFHVIDQAKSIQIGIPALGKKLVDATVVGTCPESDVALLKLTDEGLEEVYRILKKVPFLKLGDSDALYRTQEVLALGFPLGFRYLKGTVGVIAGREFLDGMCYMHITAPINQGNSGGPLLNRLGEVVGVNTAVISIYNDGERQMAAQNVGYIVPINDIKAYLKSMHSQKLVRKPVFGTAYNNSTLELTRSLNNPMPGGLYINDVVKDSVADKIGIKVGDMLYEINGFSVDQFGDVSVEWRSSEQVSLEEFLVRLPIEAPLNVVVYRKGKKVVLKGTYQELALPPIRYIYPDYEHEAIDYEIFGGLCIQQLRVNHFKYLSQTPLLQEYMRPDRQDKEVLVITRILPGSYIHKIRCLYEGALLDEVNGKPVRNLKELRKALEDSIKKGEVALKTKDKVYTVVSLDAILQDEERIARDFVFSTTKTMQTLKEGRKALNVASTK